MEHPSMKLCHRKEIGLILQLAREMKCFLSISYQSLKDFGLTDTDLSIYIPENINNIKQHLLILDTWKNYYLKWHPQSNYYYAAEHSNFTATPERTLGTYSKYNSIDDKIDDFYYTMGIKFE